MTALNGYIIERKEYPKKLFNQPHFMPRYKLTIEFDGTDFSGWQIQPDARTVEGELERVFSKILQQPVDLIGQGRTDAGVHARNQIAHVDLSYSLEELQSFLTGVNGLVGREVYIRSVERVADDFHCRFDALYREYSYTMLKRPSPLQRRHAWTLQGDYDTQLFYAVAALLEGEFDFAGFSKYNVENYTTLCTILKSEVLESDDKIVYVIRANRFLRNMVRRIVGTMFKVAEGKLSLQDFENILRNPAAQIHTFTAPAQGLVLEKVFY